MADFKSNYEVKGSIWNQTFFQKRGKTFIRKQGGVGKDQIMNDPRFARTRENGTEFGNAATAGKLQRYAFAPLVKTASDSLVTSRLTQVMTRIKNFDAESPRGERTVAIGIDTDEGKALLIDFNFNIKAILKSVLSKPFTLDAATGIISINGLVPMLNVTAPTGTTHVELVSALGTVDFEAGSYAAEYSNSVNLPYDMMATDVTLTPAALPGGKGPMFYLLHIAFFQQVNKIQYPLNNGGYNALSIIDVL